ncbi:peptidoglycan-binding domain-containing protein [Chryseobacterium sp. 22458]|uniref:peptidoglycan-binding domain-containing protein n=1 Tax=Chryseobacterium sp. 22458 TaxID=3453921 RepID=UPI003F829751
MSRYNKTFAPRAEKSEEQTIDDKEDEKKTESITDQDSKISLAKTEVTQITYGPFRNRAFRKIETGSARMELLESGPHVLILNQALNALGHKVPDNEVTFRDKTQIALINFQQKNGLTGSGIFDRETLLKMNEALENLHKMEETSSREKESQILPAADPPDEKVQISVGVVPTNIKSDQEFFEFLDIQIFGRIIDARWDIGKNTYKTYIGKETSCTVSVSSLKKHLGITDQQWEAMYKRKTSAKPNAAELRNFVKGHLKNREKAILEEINAIKKEAGALSEDKKQFIRDANSKIDYMQNRRILDLLKQLSDEEMADYKSKVSKETTDLAEIEESLKAYIENRNLRNEEKNSRAGLQNQLTGLEALYKQYIDYIKFKNSHEATLYEPGDPNKAFFENALNRQSEALFLSLNTNGFTLESFKKMITDYELSFRKETVHIAEDALIKYRHLLFEQKKKLLDNVFIKNLLEKIKASKAKESYQESDKATPHFYDRLSAPAEKEFKAKMETLAGSKKAEGDAAIKELSSIIPLTEDNGFDKEDFSKVETQQELHSFLEDYINDQEENINKIIANLHAHQGLSIYGFPDLLQKSKEQQGIVRDSIFDLIIADKTEEESAKYIIKGILIGVLAVALGLLSFGTGTVAVLLAAGNFALGAYITYEEIEAYRTQLAAYKVNISQDEPSAVWVVISVVGSLLDVAAVAKISAKLVEAGRVFELTKDINQTKKLLTEAKLHPTIQDKIIKALEEDLARIKGLENKVEANILKQTELKAEFDKLSHEFLQATATFNTGINPAALPKLTRLAGVGIQRGITTFEGFLLELQLNKIIRSIDSLTDDELRIIKDAFSKAKNNDKVAGKVDNLYNEIDVNHKPKGFESLEDIENFDPKYGRGIVTRFDDYEGYFYRNYDSKKKIFTFNHGFSNDLPKWVEDVKVPLVEGKGIPTQAYFTLRQMKLLSIAEGEIQVVKMSQIQNLDTAAFIHKMTEGKIIRNFDSIDILDAPSNAYMKTVMTQAGYETISGRITGKGQYISVKQLQKNDYPLNPKFKGSYDAFMKEHGLTLSDMLYINYNIEIKVKYVK